MRPTLTLLALLGVLSTASAQPPGCGLYFGQDDGFHSGCCSTPTPFLPEFPPIQETAVWCWMSGCTPNTYTSSVSISAPNFLYCDYAIATLNATITFPLISGGPSLTWSLSGTVIMKYSRTWGELNPIWPTPYQVWRFLVNADLQVTAPPGWVVIGNSQPGIIPACTLSPHNQLLHVVGHIDYACDGGFFPGSTGQMAAAFSFTHLPECLSHGNLSRKPIPALAAYGDSYHLVGPAPFTFGPVQEPQGTLVGEAVRGSSISLFPIVYQCQGEADVRQDFGQLATQSQTCLCAPLPVTTPLWKHQTLSGEVCCNIQSRSFSSLAFPGFVLPTGLSAMTLGRWTGGGATFFPGYRALTVYAGVLDYLHPCPTAQYLPGIENIQAVTGVATTEHVFGGAALPTSACASNWVSASNAIDLQNMLGLIPGLGANLVPVVGGPFVSSLVWNLNVL